MISNRDNCLIHLEHESIRKEKEDLQRVHTRKLDLRSWPVLQVLLKGKQKRLSGEEET